MMRIVILTAALMTASPVWAQTAPAAPVPAPATVPLLPPITTPPMDVAVLEGATVSPDCGGLYNLQGRAFCVTALLTQTGALAEAYVTDLTAKGWLVAAGDKNRMVFVRRKPDGTCDGLQMQAFYDTTAGQSPNSMGYIGFGVVPGNICASQPAAQETPQ